MIPPLTLAFSSHRLETLPQAEDLMTAHDHIIIYNQLVVREELPPGQETYPDARDDLRVIQYVNRLDYEDCRQLYGRIAGRDPRAARRAADGFPPTAVACERKKRGEAPSP